MLLTLLSNLVQIPGTPIPPIPDTGDGGGGGYGIPYQDKKADRRKRIKEDDDEWLLFIKIFCEQCQ